MMIWKTVVMLALNMMDIVQERGMELDLHRLPEMLGDIPTVPVSAARRTGLDILLHAVIHHYEEQKNAEYILQYPEEIENKIAKLEVMMEAHYPTHSSRRWHAIKLLENDEEVMKEHPINTVDVVDRSYEKEIINCKYQYIESVVREVLFYKNKKAATTDKIDKLLTNEWLGLPMFLCIMGIVFFMTFMVGDLLKGVFLRQRLHFHAAARGHQMVEADALDVIGVNEVQNLVHALHVVAGQGEQYHPFALVLQERHHAVFSHIRCHGERVDVVFLEECAGIHGRCVSDVSSFTQPIVISSYISSSFCSCSSIVIIFPR